MGINPNPGGRQDSHTTEGAMIMPFGIAKFGARIDFDRRIHDMFHLLCTREKTVSDNLCRAVLLQFYLDLNVLPAGSMQNSHT